MEFHPLAYVPPQQARVSLGQLPQGYRTAFAESEPILRSFDEESAHIQITSRHVTSPHIQKIATL